MYKIIARMPNCNPSGLEIFVPDTQNTWNKSKVQHAHRRLGFSTSSLTINSALSSTPSAYIDGLITDAIALGAMAAPSWSNMSESDYADINNEIPIQQEELALHFVDDMLENGLRGRFTLFWHNHFVTRLEDYRCPSWMYNYYQTLHVYAFGNFKSFVSTIGTTPAMLVFLNGFQNAAAEPNENYARELLELFTLGVNNGYTQTDIVNISRALTGYTGYTEYCASLSFNSDDFDTEDKTIFDQTGNWGYDDVIDILFEERGDLIATYICSKIYAHFVSPEINETIVSQLAATFTTNNFELEPVYRQLFKSNHFFDSMVIGTIVKSPYDGFIAFVIETKFEFPNDFKGALIRFSGEIGQDIFNPTDVAGWQGNHEWINSSTLLGRWQLYEYYLWIIWNDYREQLRIFAIGLSSDTETDPAVIARNIIDHFISSGLETQADYEIATVVLKNQVPQNYFDNNLWNLQWESAPYQVLALLFHITKIPSFQLK
ncbi:MAG: hypothetical protein ACI93P_001798 [bacterium]|jgi:uncharacterized protein (DUF1800 family)